MTPTIKKKNSGHSDRCFNPFGVKAHKYGISVRNSLRKVSFNIKELYKCKISDLLCGPCWTKAYKEIEEIES